MSPIHQLQQRQTAVCGPWGPDQYLEICVGHLSRISGAENSLLLNGFSISDPSRSTMEGSCLTEELQAFEVSTYFGRALNLSLHKHKALPCL